MSFIESGQLPLLIDEAGATLAHFELGLVADLRSYRVLLRVMSRVVDDRWRWDSNGSDIVGQLR